MGAYECVLAKDSLAARIYGRKSVSERHRHRYEVNPAFREGLEGSGFLVSGTNPDSGLIELMELDRRIHPYFIAGQFHPEFKSRLGRPHPLFDNLIHVSLHQKVRGDAEESPDLADAC